MAARSRATRQATLDGHDVHVAADHCDRPRCACVYCVLTWRSRAADRAAERLRKFEEAMVRKRGNVGKLKHVVVSLPDDQSRAWMERGPEAIFRELLPKVWRRLEEGGMYGAAIIVHHVRSEVKDASLGARRYHMGRNYVSLHFHVLGYGYLEDARQFKQRTGWLYKNKGARRDVAGTVSYLLDHALVVEGKHALRYFGHVSYRRLRLVSETKISEVRKCKCGDLQERYEVGPNGEVDWLYSHGAVYVVHRVRHFEFIPPKWLLQPPDPGGASA